MTKTFSTVGILAAIFLGIIGVATVAYANPSYFAAGVKTNSAASTSVAYMTPGAGTSTTPVYDACAQTVSGGSCVKADYAGLLVQFTASSTSAVLTAAVEYSNDNVDWYRNFVLDQAQLSTTTAPISLATPISSQWKFASSSVGGAAVLSTENRSTAAMAIPTPFRYTRVVFSVTGANAAVWGELVPTKQR